MNRISQIDFLRFIAALSVVFFHYTFRLFNIESNLKFNYQIFESISKYGYLGVHLFFIISGFVILMTADKSNLKRFIINRISRLYPAYWLCLSITSIIIIISETQSFNVSFFQFFVNITMFQDYFKVESVDGVYWSLFVELKFYFFIGILLYFNKLHRIKLFALLWLALTIFSMFLNPELFITKFLNFIFILKYNSLFIAGMFFYLTFRDKFKFTNLFIILICLIVSLIQCNYELKDLEFIYKQDFSEMIVYYIILLWYSLLFLISLKKLQFLNRNIFLYAGMLTYPLYLVHQIFGYILISKYGSLDNRFLLLFFIIIFMIFLSFVIAQFWEKPFRQVIKNTLANIIK